MGKRDKKPFKVRTDGYFVRKINLKELERLLNSGISQAEIARKMGVTPGAISLAKRDLERGIVKVATMEHGHELVTQHIDAGQTLSKLHHNISELLDEVSGEDRITERFTDAVDALLSDRGKKKDRQRIREAVDAIRKDRDIRVKCSQEIRGQLSLQWEITKGMVDIREMAAFQRVVVEIIRKQRPEIARELVDALKADRALRESVNLF